MEIYVEDQEKFEDTKRVMRNRY